MTAITTPQFMQWYKAWSSSVTYPFNPNEAITNGPVVSYAGNLYIAIAQPIEGHAPSLYPAEWDLLATGAGAGAASSFINGIFSTGTPQDLTDTAAVIPMASFTIVKSADITDSGNNIVLPEGNVYACVLSMQADTFATASDEVQGYFVNTTDSVNSSVASSMGFATTGKGTQGSATYIISTLAGAKTLNIGVVVANSGETAILTAGDQVWFHIYSL